MLNKIAKLIILLLCTITVVGVLSGCTETILSQNGPTAIFVAGKLDSDNTFSKSVNWLENTFSKFENLAKHGAEEKSSTFVIPDQYQVLLIGSDRRDGSWNGNSDVMILASLNRNKKTISFISFMRDTGVNVPNVGYGKLNCSFAKGGAKLLQSTLESNFRLQAVGYMRDRYVGSNDFQRTERQRIVLQKLLENLKTMNALEILKLGSSMTNLSIQHNFTAEQIAGLAALALECRNYTVVMDRIPYDGLYTSNGENLDPVWPETIEKLHATIY